MKKLFQFLVLLSMATQLHAQTVSLHLITPPCDSNGVLVGSFSGLTPPIDVRWNSNRGTESRTISILSDTLRGFTGGRVSINGVSSGFSAFRDTLIPLPFIVHASFASAVCPALGTMTGSIVGGTPPYSYNWVDYMTLTSVATGNPAHIGISGYYDLIVTDAAGCILGGSDTINYLLVSGGFSVTDTTTPAICPALGTATAYMSSSGPFTYQWINYATSTIVSTTNPASLPAGIYLVNVTDASGCTAMNEAFITNIPDFTVSLTSTPANCTDGTLTATVTGGTLPLSYHWSTGATTPSITGLSMGYYRVLITDAIGCTNDTLDADSVSQSVYIDAHTVATAATCIDTNGSVIVFGSGGLPPYTYLWSNGATTQSVGHLAAGYLDVIVTDSRGCLGSGYSYVGTSTPIYASYVTTPSSCTAPTGTATLTLSGGTLPYTIHWYTTPMQTGLTATGLAAGTYYFDVVDAAGCTQSGRVTVPPIDVINLSFTSSPATCLLSDGSVSVTATSGVPPYTYHWSTGASTASLTDVPHGLYYATVTDANGCSATNYQYVPYHSPITLGLSTTPASCLYNHDGHIVATASHGTPPYTYSPGGVSSTSATISSLATGSYWVTVTDAIGCTASDYTYLDYNHYDSSCFCLVRGNVYHDINDNCTKDVGEPGINHIQMHCTGLGYDYTDVNGDYYFLVPSGSYTISQHVLSYYPLSSCQANNIAYTAVAGTGCRTTINFADSLNPIRDMHVSNWDYTRARPGFSYSQVSVITIDGTIDESGILASYKADGQIYAPTFVPSGIFAGSAYYYNTAAGFPTLVPGDGQSFLNNYFVPASIPLGTSVNFKDTVAYQAPMSNWLTDYSPWNNTCDFNTTVVGSFDPNFKEVYPKGVGAYGYISTTDSILEYMVHFQNTGSYAAENVVVVDTLSSNLDWTTLKPVFNSNKGTVTVSETGVAKFTFNNINLPPMSAEPIMSNAFFTYTIKQRPALAIGTHIKNTAYIYFDFNAPIVTNTTWNTIGHQTAVPTIENEMVNSFNLYPNPATNTCMISLNNEHTGIAEMNMTDITGRSMQSIVLNLEKGKQNIPLSLASLTPGVYFVTINGNGLQQTHKLVIM